MRMGRMVVGLVYGFLHELAADVVLVLSGDSVLEVQELFLGGAGVESAI